jgi:HEAT repeat protein
MDGMAMTTGSEDLEQLLEELKEHPGALPYSKLSELSDLAGSRLASFRTAFDAYPASQRSRLVQALVQLAEASFEVNFDAIFRHCLGDSNEEVRAAAIEGLWEDEDVSLIGPMLSMLRADPSPQVRAAAASALGRYVLAGELEKLDPPIQARITAELLTSIHLKGESDEVRRRAIEAVSYSCTPEVFEVLETAYFHEDEEMRQSAIVGMGRTCDRRWAPTLLVELESDSPAMRYEAALASGHLMMGEAVPTLAELLDDADAQVRSAAIWALGQIGGDQAKQLLLDALEDADDDTEVVIEEALAEHALLEGDLDFAMYEFDEDNIDDLSDDTLYPLWSADDESGDGSG